MNDLRAAAEDVCARLRDAGHRAVFAGGCVRDMLLGTDPKDYDVATSATPDEVQRIFPRTVPVGVQFGVILVITKPKPIEVATFRTDGPYVDGRHPASVTFTSEEQDARRRDFTINAMFYDPNAGSVVDYVGGKDDLEAGIIRTVGEPAQRFQEDHLRLMRAIRFAARLRFTIEREAWRALCQLAPLIEHTSAERKRDELLKMLTEGNAEGAFWYMECSGLLAVLLPEITAMKGVNQPPNFHPEGDVFTHTMIMLRFLDQMVDPTPTLALGALLHDAGKPPTQTFEDRIRFSNHDNVGAEIALNICKRFRLSKEQTARVVWLVGQHMRLAAAPDMRENKRKRFVREEGFDELLDLCRLDALASHRETDIVEWLREYKDNLPQEQLRPEPLLTGKDLIDMGYEPGPLFSEILGEVEDAQLEGGIRSKEEAVRFIQEKWPRPQRKQKNR